jgi:hypothetical protein
MNEFPEQPKHSNENEINELRKELAQDREARDLAEKIVEQEDADIDRIEKKIEELEHQPVELIVNAEPKKWHKSEISYREVVILAYGNYDETDGVTYAVDYSHGPEGHREGILDKHQSVPVINKMRFRVKKANRS